MTEQRRLRSRAAAGYAGLPLAAFLARRFPYHSEKEWSDLAAAGRVKLNGAEPAPGSAVAAGDLVEYFFPPRPEPRVDETVTVLYEDADLLAVDKPGNLPVHPAGRYFRNTLWTLLRERFGLAAPGIANRLDRETSGVVLVAKNPAAAACLRRQFDARTVKKTYLAVVEGEFPEAVSCRGYMRPCPGAAVRKKRLFAPAAEKSPAPGEEPNWAETDFTRVAAGGGLSAVKAEPRTGRLHQIRATLLALGFPIAGDKVYGRDENLFLKFVADALTPEDRAALRLGRQALHALSLEFEIPSGRRLTVRAPLPADLLSLLPPLASLG